MIKMMLASLNQRFGLLAIIALSWLIPFPTFAITESDIDPAKLSNELDIDPEIEGNSGVLQRWRQEIPNVLEEIKHTPSFRTRIRLGYREFPSTQHRGGINVGVEDIFLGDTGLTLSGKYETSFNGERELAGADLNYYVLPLGNYVNLAPVVGYRHFQTTDYSTDGANLGLKLILPLSRTGAADISVSQTFIAPSSRNEVGLSTFSAGYALTPQLRLSGEIQLQNSRVKKDSSVGLFLEWMP